MKNFILAASMLVASSQALAANDSLIVTGEKAKGGTAIAIDYMSSGLATGLQFNIAVPGGDKAKVNLGNCLKSLPATHGAVCNFAKGQVIGMVFSALLRQTGSLRVPIFCHAVYNSALAVGVRYLPPSLIGF